MIKDLQLALVQVVMPANDFLIPGGADDESENFKVIDSKVRDLIEKLNRIEFGRTEEKELLNRIEKKYSGTKEIALQIFVIPNAIGNIESGRLMEKMDDIADDAARDMEMFYEFAKRDMEEVKMKEHKAKALFDIVILAGILSNIILILFGLFFFRRTISLPLEAIRNIVLEIGRGNLEKKVNVRSNDEIGDLANSFNKMTEDLKRLIQKEKELTTIAEMAVDAEKKRTVELERTYNELQMTQDQLIQAEKLNAVGLLASGVAHEVRNPLGIIIQGVNYLEEKITTKEEDVLEVLAMLKDSVKRADKIINALLDFSRAASLNLQPEDINSILENSLNLVKSQLKLENIEIVREIKIDMPRVLVDKNKIEQVFINILLNAVQAMPEGGEIIIRSYDKHLEEIKNGIGKRGEDHFRIGEKAVIVEFEDTGVGISVENIKKIFDPFFTTKSPRGGTGLGLSVSRNILHMHKGLIYVQSQIGKGTKITVILKIAGGDKISQ
ncbi:MAG: ATP-binding protein [Candidatus Omnitrophota bacterium]|nr:ATP-binding protein [Candidatus Omnitrophota bacterium]